MPREKAERIADKEKKIRKGKTGCELPGRLSIDEDHYKILIGQPKGSK